MATVSRAELLRGRFVAAPAAIRPPWALDDAAAFAAACDACGRCMPACPEKILVADRLGRPVVDFSAGACTFCGACVDACLPHALARDGERAPWRLTAAIGAKCLALSSVECRICGEHCETRAIRFRPLGRGRWLPDIETSACTGCGACIGPCPAKAITVSETEREMAACG